MRRLGFRMALLMVLWGVGLILGMRRLCYMDDDGERSGMRGGYVYKFIIIGHYSFSLFHYIVWLA
jgi:hypothetical protein